eukprot:CAMPEP_0168735560 /NCGR_PEP_ID=MMETSP0724-20121128/9400_1 /TAXON_ID=265536 /ORGANISM="Amphiprora sp., Strain CCMP467" /LENGTH=311 /DNA_ID=CAMNT_0008782715 /DNA_START=67 /DNA_END=1002 /DNA_ORIENTATION=+
MTHQFRTAGQLALLSALLLTALSSAFSPLSRTTTTTTTVASRTRFPDSIHNRQSSLLLRARKSNNDDDNLNNNNFLMDDYRDPTTGEILDPYRILKIPRDAPRQQIKQAYRNLSRRYHPDTLLHRDILPGSCNNPQDVRNHWERVKLSYEILSDPKQRKRFDRHEALHDPQAALQRAASQAVVGATVALGKGLWGLGSSVVQGAAGAAAAKVKEQQQQQQEKQKVTQNNAAVTAPTTLIPPLNNNNNNTQKSSDKETKRPSFSPFGDSHKRQPPTKMPKMIINTPSTTTTPTKLNTKGIRNPAPIRASHGN